MPGSPKISIIVFGLALDNPGLRFGGIATNSLYETSLILTSALSTKFSDAPYGQTLASGSDDHTVRLWDVTSGQCLKILQGHTNGVWSVAFSPDGQTLASGSDDHTVRLWDVTSGQCLKILQGHTNGVWSVAFSPDGQTLASGSQDETIKLWDVQTGECCKILRSERLYEGMNIPHSALKVSHPDNFRL